RRLPWLSSGPSVAGERGGGGDLRNARDGRGQRDDVSDDEGARRFAEVLGQLHRPERFQAPGPCKGLRSRRGQEDRGGGLLAPAPLEEQGRDVRARGETHPDEDGRAARLER